MKTIAEIIDTFDGLKNGYVEQFGDDGGALKITIGHKRLSILFSDGGGWDHVSVSGDDRIPNYQEMKRIKRLLFNVDEWVIEYHPPAKKYISDNNFVLHMWRPQNEPIPIPPSMMV